MNRHRHSRDNLRESRKGGTGAMRSIAVRMLRTVSQVVHTALPVTMYAFGSLVLCGVQDARASTQNCEARSAVCININAVDPHALHIWDNSPNTRPGPAAGGHDNNLDIRADSLVQTDQGDYLRIRVEEKNAPLELTQQTPQTIADAPVYDVGCGRETSNVYWCNIRASKGGTYGDCFEVNIDLGAGDDASKFSVSDQVRSAGGLSRIRTTQNAGFGNDSIISDATSDIVDLGPGDDYGDLGGAPAGGKDRGFTGPGYDVLYCDTAYDNGANAGTCELVGGPTPGYDWLFAAKPGDNATRGQAGAYIYFPDRR